MATATKKTYVPETSAHREYKYSQEISQMMFVFGEVQDPNPETVNLVEDIVRSQLIELVCFCILWCLTVVINSHSRFSKPVRSPTDVVHDTSPLKTSYSSSVMTARRSIDYERTSHGKMCANTRRTRMEAVAVAWRLRI